VKKSRFTDEQIAFALKQAETGTRIDEICRKMDISAATFDLLPSCRTKVMEQSPLISENSGYETIQIYR